MDDINKVKTLQHLHTFYYTQINNNIYITLLFYSNNITNHHCPSIFNKLFFKEEIASNTTPHHITPYHTRAKHNTALTFPIRREAENN